MDMIVLYPNSKPYLMLIIDINILNVIPFSRIGPL